MTEELKQTIEKEVKELPKEWREAINSVNWTKISEDIAKKFSVETERTDNFQLETLLVLIGATDPEFYAINIENQIGITKDMSENIAKEVSQKIFKPIYEALKQKTIAGLKEKNPTWKQNVDFILSGGDYNFFLEEPAPRNQTDNTPRVNTDFITKKI